MGFSLELLAIVPGVLAMLTIVRAFLAVVTRSSALDLEIRTHRARKQTELRSARGGDRGPATDLPSAIVVLVDAERITEWEAHLYERIENGELREARADRRSVILFALALALTKVAHRALRKRAKT